MDGARGFSQLQRSRTNSFGRGGGAPGYLTGVEVYYDLSAANKVGTAADIGKTVLLYSSTEGKSYQFVDARQVPQVGRGMGFRMMPGSMPIKIINPGTPGTDPILECLLMPNANVSFVTQSISTAIGDWRAAGGSVGMFPGPVPVTLPYVTDAGLDMGATAASMEVSLGLAPNITRIKLTSTTHLQLYLPSPYTTLKGVVWSYNHATDAWTAGTPASIVVSTGAQVLAAWRLLDMGSGKFAVICFEYPNPNGPYHVIMGSVSGTTITMGTEIVSGAWAVNPINPQCGQNGTLVADSATTFFWALALGGSTLCIAHFSSVGNNVALDGITNFAGATSFSVAHCIGYSAAANTIELGHPPVLATFPQGIHRYTYAAGSITHTTTKSYFPSGVQVGPNLQCVDATNRIFWGGDATQMFRAIVNAGYTAITEFESFKLPLPLDAPGTASRLGTGNLLLSDTEALFMPDTGSMTLYNPWHLRRNKQIASTTAITHDQCKIRPAAFCFGTPIGSTGFGTIVDTTLRRLSLSNYTSYSSGGVASRQLINMMFDLPRNYDNAVT